jgi:hypothetical protein
VKGENGQEAIQRLIDKRRWSAYILLKGGKMKRVTLVLLVFLVFSCLSLTSVYAQLAQAKPQMMPGFQTEGSPGTVGRTLLENVLSIAVLAFGLILAGILTIAAVKAKAEKPFGTNYVKLVGLTIVITAGLFLICAGYTQDQIAPMVGLLGTIAGYLLGKGESKASEKE